MPLSALKVKSYHYVHVQFSPHLKPNKSGISLFILSLGFLTVGIIHMLHLPSITASSGFFSLSLKILLT